MILSFIKYKLKQLPWSSISLGCCLILLTLMFISLITIADNIFAKYTFITSASLLAGLGLMLIVWEYIQSIKKIKKEYYLFKTLRGQLLPPCFGIFIPQKNCKTCELSDLCFLQRSLYV